MQRTYHQQSIENDPTTPDISLPPIVMFTLGCGWGEGRVGWGGVGVRVGWGGVRWDGGEGGVRVGVVSKLRCDEYNI